MKRFAVFLKFTDKGIAHIKESPSRASQFVAMANKAGVKVEAQYWLLGEYDGMLILSGDSEEKITALVLQLSSLDHVRSKMCRAFNEAEFKGVVGMI